MRLTTLLILCSLASQLLAQNKVEFFKVYPSDAEIYNLPQWAQDMYSPDPSIFDVADQYKAYYKQHKFVKTTHTQNYKFWLKRTNAYLDKEGKINYPSEAKILKTELEKQKQSRKRTKLKSGAMSWTSIGPFETFEAGTTIPITFQSNVFSITQSTSNPNILICGTESGGVFKTSDKGLNWSFASASATFSNGLTAVAIHPTDTNTFFTAAYGDLYKTIDGGNNWKFVHTGGAINEIKFDPSNPDRMFITSDTGVYESTNGGSIWINIFIQRAFDLDYHPTNNNIIYLLLENDGLSKHEFHRSTDNGATWSLMTSGWYNPQVPAEASVDGGKIGTSIADPDRVYAALIGNSKAGDIGWIGTYRSNDSGASWTLPAPQIGGPYMDCNIAHWNIAAFCGFEYHQGFYNFDLEVSPTNADKLWIGTVRLNESNDGGATYQSIGGYDSTRLPSIHPDIQSIHVSGNDIWVATDGGIDYSNNNLIDSEARTRGISAVHYWGFDSGWNEDVIAGGRYHNGNAVMYETYGVGKSHLMGGVEEPAGHVNVMNNKRVYFGCCYDNPDGFETTTFEQDIPLTFGGDLTNYANINFRQNEHYIPYETSQWKHHPNYADVIFAGLEAAIWKSIDAGRTWNVLYDFVNGYVTEIEISRADKDVMYLLNRIDTPSSFNTQIQKSTDGGTTWTVITTPPTDNSYRFTITTNPADQNEIWAAAPYGSNGSKVFRSLDGGSTWTNLSSALFDNQQIHDIEFHGGSNGLVYLVTDSGFYYYDPNASSWVQYNMGLPFNLSDQEVKFIRLFYRDNKIRLASGIGVWEAPFPAIFAPVAEPITNKFSVDCDQLVQLESYSMVNHASTSWLWTIMPAPNYISDNTARNPQATFSPGQYTISLQVTNSAGTSTRKVVDMIEVLPNCGNQCPAVLDVMGPISSGSYQASHKILSSDVVSAGNAVDFRAVDCIELEPNFEIKLNSEFTADLGNCDVDGYSCVTPIVVGLGTHTAPGPDQDNGATQGDATHANWFSYTPTTSGTIDVFSCFQGVDTRLWIYSGTCGALTLVDDNDDACLMNPGGDPYASELLNVPVTAGVTYYIEWDDFWTTSGFQFTIQ